jgi:hypothetical protein
MMSEFLGIRDVKRLCEFTKEIRTIGDEKTGQRSERDAQTYTSMKALSFSGLLISSWTTCSDGNVTFQYSYFQDSDAIVRAVCLLSDYDL